MGEAVHVGEGKAYKDSLHLSLNFSVNVKLPKRIVYFQKIKEKNGNKKSSQKSNEKMITLGASGQNGRTRAVFTIPPDDFFLTVFQHCSGI